MSEFGDCHCGKPSVCLFGAGDKTMPVCQEHLEESFAAVNNLMNHMREMVEAAEDGR